MTSEIYKYGRLCGTQFPEQVILSGSHIDTVVNGGNSTGNGALAARLALDWLKATYGAPLRTVEVASTMAEEEGSRFLLRFWGSKNIFWPGEFLKR